MNSAQQILMIFAKAPLAGYAKTRLAPALGDQGAAQLQQQLFEHTLKQCALSDEWQTQLWCAPDCRHPVFQQAEQAYQLTLKSQADGDLGQRMAQAFANNFPQAERVVIIGTDCPAMDAARVRQAFAALLAGSSVVINPAEDGGYVLLGMRGQHTELFENITWGSAEVMMQTRERLRTAGLDFKLLPELWDLDDEEDLRRYQALAMV